MPVYELAKGSDGDDLRAPSYGLTQAPLPPVGGDGISLRSLFDVVLREKWTIAASVALCIVLAFIHVWITEPTYSATTLVMVEVGRGDSMLADSVVESEIHYLRSGGFASSALEALRLQADPEFNAAVREVQGRRQAGERHWVGRVIDWLVSKVATEKQDPEARALDQFYKRMSVQRAGISNVIALSFSSEDPQKAARIANGIAEHFLDQRLDRQLAAARRGIPALEKIAAEQRDQVEGAERAVQGFRASAGIIQGGFHPDSTIMSEELSRMREQLVLASAERAQAEASLAQIRSLQRQQALDTDVSVLDSPVIQGLRQQEAALTRQMGELATDYGPSHPRMKALAAEMRDLEAKISQQTSRILRSHENKVAVSQAREAALLQLIRHLEQRVMSENEAEARLRVLTRQAEASRNALDDTLKRLEEARALLVTQQPAAMTLIASRALPPQRPVSPKPVLVLAIAILSGAVIGLLAIMLKEALRDGFRSGQEVEDAFGLPFLGVIPRVDRAWLTRGAAVKDVRKPYSSLSQAYSRIYVNILTAPGQRMLERVPLLEGPGQRPTHARVIIVTSAVPAEGKTTTAIGLAASAVRLGQSVVLVEADMRRPRVADMLGFRPSIGLAEVLQDQAALEDVIKTHGAFNFRIVAAGYADKEVSALLGSWRMAEVLLQLRAHHDLVIIDTPPIAAFPDHRLLPTDGAFTLYLAAWGKTRRSIIRYALRHIDVGADDIGVALSMVNTSRYAAYSSGDAVSYSREVQRYYATQH